MLTVTEAAADAIRAIVENENLPETGGIRITLSGDEVDLNPSNGARVGDETVETSGARVFLDEGATEALDEFVLDAHAHGDHFHFSLEPQE